MQNTIGISIFTGAFIAFSCAACLRRDAHVLGLVAEHGRHRDAELVGLADGGDERPHLGDLHAVGQTRAARRPGWRPTRISARASANSSDISPSMWATVRDDRGREAEAGLHADDEQVHDVGELPEDRSPRATPPATGASGSAAPCSRPPPTPVHGQAEHPALAGEQVPRGVGDERRGDDREHPDGEVAVGVGVGSAGPSQHDAHLLDPPGRREPPAERA